MGLAVTLEPLEPFHLEPLSVLNWVRSRNGSICKRAEPNGTVPKESGYLMRDNSFVCFIISLPKYQRKLDFCDLVHHPPLFLLLLEPFGTFSRLNLKYGTVRFQMEPFQKEPFRFLECKQGLSLKRWHSPTLKKHVIAFAYHFTLMYLASSSCFASSSSRFSLLSWELQMQENKTIN